jgi:hypothetical protein
MLAVLALKRPHAYPRALGTAGVCAGVVLVWSYYSVLAQVDREGDVFRLHGGVYHAFLSLLHLVCVQGHRARKQLGYAFFSEVVSTMDSITSGTGLAPLEGSLKICIRN